jgi:PAS domain S-box-containing protein
MSGQRGDAMPAAAKTKKELLTEIEDLRLRLEEAEETLRAIGSGAVDAFVVTSPAGEQQVFTLKGAEQPYRILVESMNEGAATLAADGSILYCNKRLSAILNISLESLIGTKLGSYVDQKYYNTYTALLENCTWLPQSEEIAMITEAGSPVPVFISCCANDISGTRGLSVVVTDLTLQRRNEEILASEKFATSIIEQASEAMIVCDAKGKIIRASQAAHALCGTNPLLKQFNKVFPLRFTASGEQFSLVSLVHTDILTSTEVEFKRDDEQIFNLLLNASTLRSLQDLAIGSVITLTDITSRKKAEVELQLSEGRLQAAYSQLQVASEELQVQSEELQSQNQELQELWEKSRQAEATLLESRHDLDRAQEVGSIGSWRLDVRTNVLTWSDENYRIFGIPKGTPLTYETFLSAIHPDDRHYVNTRWNAGLRGEPYDIEHRLLVNDRVKWVREKAYLEFEEDGTLIGGFGITQDITDRKQAEIALQANEQRMQQALHVSRSFTFDWLPVTDQVMRSASCAEILKLVGDEAVNDTGAHFFQSVHPDDRARFRQTLGDLTPASDSYITEYRYVSKDGSEITLEETGRASFDDSGRIQRLVGVSTDITLRKNVERALTLANDELELRVAERTRELADSISHLRNEIRERKLAEVSLRKETANRVQAMEALREKEQMLIQQSRQAAMGEMIGNIAHQWRQPLNALGLYTQRLGVFYGMPDFNKEFLDSSIAKSMEIIKHMSKTIDDFRDYFKPEKEKADFYVIEAIKNTLSLLEGNFNNPKIAINVVEHDNPVINGYQNEFAQVFLNILNNARDAIIERDIADARVSITICCDSRCAFVTVADNAGGIPDEIINKVFDPYFTTKGPQAGTGIGLFMSKTIIEKNMGGRLTVRNTDIGAEFRIEVEHGTQN